MIKRIIAYIFFGLGLLTITFFKKYSGTIIPYPILFYLLGFVLFIVGIILLRKTPTVKEQKDTGKLNNEIRNLISQGMKVEIDLSKCIIKENNYVEEADKYNSGSYITTLDLERNIQAANILLGKSVDNAGRVQVFQTVLVFTADLNGKTTKFVSRTLPFDRVNLMFKLDKQKETLLYVDKIDTSKYYFDLVFLSV